MSGRAPVPWHRERMLWLVIALPLAAVVAGFATLVIAIRAGGSDAVPDEVRRRAQIQTSDLSADARAADLRLAGEIRVESDTGAVRVRLNRPIDTPALELRLVHPTDAIEDRAIPLIASGSGTWLGRLGGIDLDHDWLLQLAPADRGWRLQGRWQSGAAMAPLEPALAHP